MKTFIAAAGLIAIGFATPVLANEYSDQLTALAKGKIAEMAQNALVIDAIAAQNAQTSGYDQAKIDTLDKTWRAEVDASAKPMIEAVLSTPLSGYLLEQQDGSEGLFTEIFVMDAKGLNVGQSSVTSDYWQGDEGKWKNTYAAGAGAIDISEVEQDESTQTFQSQVSVTIVDAAGTPIGAVTVGVNVENL